MRSADVGAHRAIVSRGNTRGNCNKYADLLVDHFEKIATAEFWGRQVEGIRPRARWTRGRGKERNYPHRRTEMQLEETTKS